MSCLETHGLHVHYSYSTYYAVRIHDMVPGQRGGWPNLEMDASFFSFFFSFFLYSFFILIYLFIFCFCFPSQQNRTLHQTRPFPVTPKAPIMPSEYASGIDSEPRAWALLERCQLKMLLCLVALVGCPGRWTPATLRCGRGIVCHDATA